MTKQSEHSSEITRIQSELFTDIDSALVDQWFSQCSQLVFKAGDVVIAQGARNTSLYILTEGELDVHVTPEHEMSFATLRPGDVAGEVSLLSARETSAWVTARKKSTAIQVPGSLLLQWAEESHQFALNLLRLSNTRLHNSNAFARSTHARAETLRAKAMTDSLTGLLNRHWLEINHNRFRGISVIAIDIDHFKQINDRYGHLTGDQVIKAVAKALQFCTRPHDAVMRLGGEEFAAVIDLSRTETTPVKLAERMRTAVMELQVDPINPSDEHSLLQVRISLGVATQQPGEEWTSLMQRADQALYAAKQGGRNRVEVADTKTT